MRVWILILATLLTSTSFGLNLPPTAKEAAYFYYKNKIINPGFENGSSNWTASGGSFTVTTTAADLAEGARSAVFDASASAQTLSSSNYTIERGLRQNNAYAKCRVRTTASDYILDVYDGTNVLASQTIQATSEFSEQGINFVFPTSGTARIRIRSQSNAAAVYVDDCYLGAAPNIQSARTSQFVGSSYFAQTTNCSWSRTNTAIGAFSTDADCPGPTVGVSKLGSWQTTDADLPRQTINSLPEGLYEVTVTGSLYGGGDWTMAVSDGTTTSPVYCSGSGNGGGTFQPSTSCSAWFEYSTEGNRSFEIYGSSSSGAISLDNNANNDRTSFSVRRWDRYPSTFASINNTDYGWTQYTPTFTGFGTVTVHACYHSRQAENLKVRCKFTPGTTTATEARLSFPGSLVSVSTIDTLELAGTAVINVTTNGYASVLREPSVSYFTFGRDGGGSTGITKFNGSTWVATGNVVSFEAEVPIAGWSPNQSTPVFVGSVSSNSTGAEKIERLIQSTACTSTPCTPNSQSGPWHGTTYTRSSTGQYSLTVSGWSDRPACICSYGENSTSGVCNVQVSSATTILVRVQDSAFGQADKPFSLICMGPR